MGGWEALSRAQSETIRQLMSSDESGTRGDNRCTVLSKDNFRSGDRQCTHTHTLPTDLGLCVAIFSAINLFLGGFYSAESTKS